EVREQRLDVLRAGEGGRQGGDEVHGQQDRDDDDAPLAGDQEAPDQVQRQRSSTAGGPALWCGTPRGSGSGGSAANRAGHFLRSGERLAYGSDQPFLTPGAEPVPSQRPAVPLRPLESL